MKPVVVTSGSRRVLVPALQVFSFTGRPTVSSIHAAELREAYKAGAAACLAAIEQSRGAQMEERLMRELGSDTNHA